MGRPPLQTNNFFPLLPGLDGVSCGHHASFEPVKHRANTSTIMQEKNFFAHASTVHFTGSDGLGTQYRWWAGKGSKNYNKDRQIQMVLLDDKCPLYLYSDVSIKF